MNDCLIIFHTKKLKGLFQKAGSSRVDEMGNSRVFGFRTAHSQFTLMELWDNESPWQLVNKRQVIHFDPADVEILMHLCVDGAHLS